MGGGKKLLGLNKWAWMGVVALGVVVFIYFRRHNGQKKADTANAPQEQDASATDTASLGGMQPSTDAGAVQGTNDGALLAALLQLMEQSQMQYGEYYPALTGSGVYSGGGGGTVPGTASSFGGANVSAQSSAQDAPADISNPATSFFPAGTDVSAGDAPLYAFSGGNQIAASPVAGSVFSPFEPAASGYQALGVAPSAPVTFAPDPTITAPYEPRNNPTVGQPVAA